MFGRAYCGECVLLHLSANSILCSANARLAYADSAWRTADRGLKSSALPIAAVDIFAK